MGTNVLIISLPLRLARFTNASFSRPFKPEFGMMKWFGIIPESKIIRMERRSEKKIIHGRIEQRNTVTDLGMISFAIEPPLLEVVAFCFPSTELSMESLTLMSMLEVAAFCFP